MIFAPQNVLVIGFKARKLVAVRFVSLVPSHFYFI